MHKIIIVFIFVFLFLLGCSYSEVKNASGKVYTIIDQKQTVLLSVLNQERKNSYFYIKNNRIYIKIEFNHGQLLVYLVGLYSKGDVSNISAYHFDSRAHQVTINHKMSVHDFKINYTDNMEARLSGKLISIAKGAHTNYHQNKKVVELTAIELNKATSREVLKNENPFIKERLLKHFPQFDAP